MFDKKLKIGIATNMAIAALLIAVFLGHGVKPVQHADYESVSAVAATRG